MVKLTFASVAIVAATLVGLSGKANAEWYVSGSLGLQSLEDSSVTAGGLRGTFKFEDGWAANAAVGYKFLNQFRVEAEGGYSQNDLKSLSLLGTTVGLSGNVDAYTFSVNGFYDISTGTFATPYLGGGLGFANSRINNLTALGINFGSSSRETDLLWLLEAGVSLKLMDHLSIVPAYRYQQISSDQVINGNTGTHIFKLGLRYSF
jgi:opacity protein-like surface antigen